LGSEGLEGGEGLVCCGVLINNHDHSLLAMASLRAINPNRSRVINRNSVCGRGRGRGTDGHEAGVETNSARRVESDGLAGLCEGRLSDSVVVGRELELDHVAYRGFDVVGAVGEGAVCVADLHDVHDY